MYAIRSYYEINEQNEVADPIPYLAIARTYSQIGEFFIAARNVMRALEITPQDPRITSYNVCYTKLLRIFFKFI